MAEVTHLRQCYRCRRIFPARREALYCPTCERELRRERNRRKLMAFGHPNALRSAAPLLMLLLSIALGTLAALWLPRPASQLAPLAGAALGMGLAWRQVNR